METVHLYGNMLDEEDIRVLYHGISFLYITSFITRFCSPTSMTRQLSVAKIFCGDQGIILEVQQHRVEMPTFGTVHLPEDSVRISDIENFDKHSTSVVEYMAARNLNLDDTDYYWCPQLGYRDRIIIPFYYEGRIVGYTARTVGESKPKYLTDSQPGFVYGLDEQREKKAFTLVCEGPIDALHIEGCALTGSDIGDAQALLLNKLGKDIYVVPDRDKAGSKLVEQAIDRGRGVSLPDWDTDINDIGECVQRHGRLYTLYNIVAAAETSPLKIRLKAKKWFG